MVSLINPRKGLELQRIVNPGIAVKPYAHIPTKILADNKM
jgi:hypothetical protein